MNYRKCEIKKKIIMLTSKVIVYADLKIFYIISSS